MAIFLDSRLLSESLTFRRYVHGHNVRSVEGIPVTFRICVIVVLRRISLSCGTEPYRTLAYHTGTKFTFISTAIQKQIGA